MEYGKGFGMLINRFTTIDTTVCCIQGMHRIFIYCVVRVYITSNTSTLPLLELFRH